VIKENNGYTAAVYIDWIIILERIAADTGFPEPMENKDITLLCKIETTNTRTTLARSVSIVTLLANLKVRKLHRAKRREFIPNPHAQNTSFRKPAKRLTANAHLKVKFKLAKRIEIKRISGFIPKILIFSKRVTCSNPDTKVREKKKIIFFME
jgi:hypothetical protein